jgi:hypothetical protein
MKTLSFVVLLFMFLTSLPLRTYSGERFGLRGHVELGGSVDFTNVSQSQVSQSTSTFSISPYVGYFVATSIEIGIRPFITIVSPSSGSSTTQLAIFLAPAYNFYLKKSTITPFVEGLIGYSSIDMPPTSSTTSGTTVSGFAYGGRGGVKAQISDFGLLNIGIQYVSLDRTPEKATTTNRENRLSVSVGFSIFAY